MFVDAIKKIIKIRAIARQLSSPADKLRRMSRSRSSGVKVVEGQGQWGSRSARVKDGWDQGRWESRLTGSKVKVGRVQGQGQWRSRSKSVGVKVDAVKVKAHEVKVRISGVQGQCRLGSRSGSIVRVNETACFGQRR